MKQTTFYHPFLESQPLSTTFIAKISYVKEKSQSKNQYVLLPFRDVGIFKINT